MAAALLTLTGCTRIQVWLGSRVRLEKLPIISIEARQLGDPGIVPGQKVPLFVSVKGPDGKPQVTEGAGQGRVLWEDLHIAATVVGVNGKGIASLSPDPRISDGKTPHLVITVPSHPDLRAELDIPVRYDASFTSDFSGRAGWGGTNGSDGLDGSSGSSGSMDPNNPSPGGDGSDGGSGSDGTDGGPGEDALSVQVRVALRAGSRPLLQVSVAAAGREDLFLVDPQGGSLTVKAEGGPGGSGGKGGRGGRGGSGGSGSPSGRSGSDGSSGRDGWDGSPGRAGSITVTYDPQAKPYMGALICLYRDGASRSGPVPVFREVPVPPLW
ncbi:MAG TPA: hypothetical protein VF378_12905 [Geothrix sp.]